MERVGTRPRRDKDLRVESESPEITPPTSRRVMCNVGTTCPSTINYNTKKKNYFITAELKAIPPALALLCISHFPGEKAGHCRASFGATLKELEGL